MKHLEYKGYTGTIEYSQEDALLFGKVLGIKSLLSYDGLTGAELDSDFRAAIDLYLSDCTSSGIAPDGHVAGIPLHSTKFRDSQAMKDAIDNVKPGTPAFGAKVHQPNGLWEIEHPGNFGYGYSSGGGGPVPKLKVTAVYKQMQDGSFKLFTMYPNR